MFGRLDKLSRLCETGKKHNPSNYSVIINTEKNRGLMFSGEIHVVYVLLSV